MKYKTLCLLIIICLAGLLSSAKQEGMKCGDKPGGNVSIEIKCTQPAQCCDTKKADIALPPLRLLRFDI